MLGNFYTQMSFLGSIGYIMKNSELAKALSTVYGEEPIKKINEHGLATTVVKRLENAVETC